MIICLQWYSVGTRPGSGVVPKDRTKHVQCGVAGARQGYTWDTSTKEGTCSRCLRHKVHWARRGTEAQSGFWGNWAKLRDNLAVYRGNVYSYKLLILNLGYSTGTGVLYIHKHTLQLIKLWMKTMCVLGVNIIKPMKCIAQDADFSPHTIRCYFQGATFGNQVIAGENHAVR